MKQSSQLAVNRRRTTRAVMTASANELVELMQEGNGVLTPEVVVQRAERPESSLHHHFTWDDRQAAHRFRLQEARQLIGSFTIYHEERQLEVRAFTALDVDRRNGGGYRSTSDIMQRSDLRKEMLNTALKELKALETKYRHLQELTEVWAAIDRQEAA